jgi:hypothetical protein
MGGDAKRLCGWEYWGKTLRDGVMAWNLYGKPAESRLPAGGPPHKNQGYG